MLSKIKNTILLSHTDLDGESCIILAQNYFKNLVSKRISYSAILHTLQEIVAELSTSDEKLQLLITDLKMSEQDFQYLQENHQCFSNIVVIDHHLYDFEIPNIPNAEVYINTNYCATALTYKYLSKEIDLSAYKRFVKLVNTYDLWQYNSIDFDEAKTLNRLYWHMGARTFNRRFFFTPKITENMRLKAQELVNEIQQYFKECEAKGALFYTPEVTVALCDKHIGELKEFYDSAVIINLRGLFHYSIRFSDTMDDETAEKLRDLILSQVSEEICISKGGHLKAFGITMQEMSLERAKAETEKLARVASEFLKN